MYLIFGNTSLTILRGSYIAVVISNLTSAINSSVIYINDVDIRRRRDRRRRRRHRRGCRRCRHRRRRFRRRRRRRRRRHRRRIHVNLP